MISGMELNSHENFTSSNVQVMSGILSIQTLSVLVQPEGESFESCRDSWSPSRKQWCILDNGTFTVKSIDKFEIIRYWPIVKEVKITGDGLVLLASDEKENYSCINAQFVYNENTENIGLWKSAVLFHRTSNVPCNNGRKYSVDSNTSTTSTLYQPEKSITESRDFDAFSIASDTTSLSNTTNEDDYAFLDIIDEFTEQELPLQNTKHLDDHDIPPPVPPKDTLSRQYSSANKRPNSAVKYYLELNSDSLQIDELENYFRPSSVGSRPNSGWSASSTHLETIDDIAVHINQKFTLNTTLLKKGGDEKSEERPCSESEYEKMLSHSILQSTNRSLAPVRQQDPSCIQVRQQDPSCIQARPIRKLSVSTLPPSLSTKSAGLMSAGAGGLSAKPLFTASQDTLFSPTLNSAFYEGEGIYSLGSGVQKSNSSEIYSSNTSFSSFTNNIHYQQYYQESTPITPTNRSFWLVDDVRTLSRHTTTTTSENERRVKLSSSSSRQHNPKLSLQSNTPSLGLSSPLSAAISSVGSVFFNK